MAVKMPLLPYPQNALEPWISEQTLQYHYGKHHKAYVDKTNAMTAGTELEKAGLKEIIKNSSGSLFNVSAQAWNHEFYWSGLCPPSQKGPIPQNISKAIEQKFGSLDEFKKKFSKEALSHFGSGWTWLVKDAGGQLKITSTHDADTPLKETPLLTCDVWEHAYYIDYRNDRGRYLEGFWNIANWEFADQNLSS